MNPDFEALAIRSAWPASDWEYAWELLGESEHRDELWPNVETLAAYTSPVGAVNSILMAISKPVVPMWLEESEPVHLWFSLSYSNYLVLPRTLMQSMPTNWQRRMVQCLEEISRAFDHVEMPVGYLVQARGENGAFIKDSVPHYNRGRTHIEPRLPEHQPS